jgi:hypothetical protein
MATDTPTRTAPAASTAPTDSDPTLDQEGVDFYRQAMRVLQEAEVPFLVGGAYAFARYTGVVRHTKDFDIFIRPRDFERALAALEGAGYPVERNFPHWLGKAWCGEYFVDLIFSSGNGIARVDPRWFEHAVDETVLEMPVKLIPVEEMIWSKAFIMERERFDGADVAHLLRGSAGQLDWDRLVARFGDNWPVLYVHLVLFTYIYPGERDAVPQRLLAELSRRLTEQSVEQGERAGGSAGSERVCRGTVLSRSQYLIDIERWGYRDARLSPQGNMNEDEIEVWTEAAREEEKKLQQG